MSYREITVRSIVFRVWLAIAAIVVTGSYLHDEVVRPIDWFGLGFLTCGSLLELIGRLDRPAQ